MMNYKKYHMSLLNLASENKHNSYLIAKLNRNKTITLGIFTSNLRAFYRRWYKSNIFQTYKQIRLHKLPTGSWGSSTNGQTCCWVRCKYIKMMIPACMLCRLLSQPLRKPQPPPPPSKQSSQNSGNITCLSFQSVTFVRSKFCFREINSIVSVFHTRTNRDTAYPHMENTRGLMGMKQVSNVGTSYYIPQYL